MKKCRPGYERDEETGKCNGSDWAAALCKKDDEMNDSCMCGEDASYEAKCFY